MKYKSIRALQDDNARMREALVVIAAKAETWDAHVLGLNGYGLIADIAHKALRPEEEK